ncbi:BZ3500_MvSof-1268-A1-R1_Chr1-3g02022 [Microbotryum saponariae]|uniref:BZ3500_MvSof-1268-A1-R1_Chr1-3g02022 protein n=1 Tax=Microbotryum saponariae TaxID=289078 RepID=A0A2X0KB31_9BASI|nr:BZ3500_MvSof-1268-A1-R1_Chr1-3g02022 [Microbotryum saponariae]SCZ95173.1 BZ3501_MvSof-1269-A2-R1_Chr1-3g01624 [Microbotryum saponariae]
MARNAAPAKQHTHKPKSASAIASGSSSSQPTLRTLRHHASTGSNAASSTGPVPAPNAMSTLTPAERIALHAQKPVIKGPLFRWKSPAQLIAATQVDLQRIQARREMLHQADTSSTSTAPELSEPTTEGDHFQTTLFGQSLQASQLINLSSPFIAFTRDVGKKASSLPLVVHYRKQIVGSLCDALSLGKHSRSEIELCAETILDLIPPLVTDLSTLLTPLASPLITTLIALTQPSPLEASNPRLLQKVYDVLGETFKELARDLLASGVEMEDVWAVVRRGLGAPMVEEVKDAEDMEVGEVIKEVEQPVEEEDDEEEEEEEELVAPVASTSASTSTTPPQPPTPQAPVWGLPTNFRTTPQTRRLLASAFSYLIRKVRTTTTEQDSDSGSEMDRLMLLLIEDVVETETTFDESAQKGKKRKGKVGRAQELGSPKAFAEGLLWSLIESCTAANGHLHSRTASIVRSSLQVVVSRAEASSELVPQAFQTFLSTLANHSKSTEIYSVVVDEVIEASRALVEGEKDWTKLEYGLKFVDCVAASKKGGRISATAKPQLFAILASYAKLVASASAPASFVQAYTSATISLLLQASFKDVLSGAVRDSIDVLWTTSSTFANACTLALALDDVAWPHYSTSIANHVLTTTAKYLEGEEEGDVELGQLSNQTNAMTLLARLAWSGRLASLRESSGGLSKSWERVVTDRCEVLIRAWIQTYSESTKIVDDDATHEVLNALLVLPQLPSHRTALLSLLCDLIIAISPTPAMQARTKFLETAANPAQVLGAALLSIARAQETSGHVVDRLRPSLLKILQGFSWHRGVMQGIAGLELASSSSTSDSITDQASQVYEAVVPNLLSEDSSLRLTSLEILTTLFEEKDKVALDLMEKMMEVERMVLSVQGAREKSMKVRKIGIVAHAQLGKEGQGTEMIVGVLLRYLTAMLKVNFKPLWPEAIQALSLLSQRFPNEVWAIASKQLVVVATRDSSLYVSRKPEWALAAKEGVESYLVVFEEPQVRDHAVEELRNVVVQRLGLFEGGVEHEKTKVAVLVEAQIAPERLVLQSYEAQLLELFCVIPDLAERHSRDFVTVFLGCFQREDRPGSKADDSIVTYVDPNESTKERQLRLRAWLAMFAKFSNPKALYRSDDLAAHFRYLLAFPDTEVQKLALDCLLRWKTPAVVANADRLRNMLEPTRLRDELLQFVSGTDAGGLEPNHRADVVPLFIRISYGIMTSRLGRASASSGQGRAGRRAAILGALKTCSSEELGTLVDLVIGPMQGYIVSAPGEEFHFASQSLNIAGKRQLGFLGFLADVLKHLGKHLVSRWHELIAATLNLLYFAQNGIEAENATPGEVDEVEEDREEDENDSDEPETAMAPLRHIRQVALKRWAEFFWLEVDFDHTPYIKAAFPVIIAPRLPSLAAENAQAPSALLELFCTWSIRRDLLNHLVVHDRSLLPKLYGCLTTRNVKPAVILRIFDIVDSLLEFASEEGGKESEVGRTIVQPSVEELLVQLGGLIAVTTATMDPKAEVGQRQITLLSSLAPYVESSEQATHLLTLITPLLRKPNKTVPERTKTELLKILTSLYPLARPERSNPLFDRCCEVISALFSSNRTRNARLQTVAAFNAIASTEDSLAQVAHIVEELNSYSVKRSEEPDFDRRLAAFSSLNEDTYRTIRPADWIIVIHNMLFFVQDQDELAIRSNASFTLRRFVEIAGSMSETNEEIKSVLVRTFLPGLRNALRSKLEIVRSEVLGVYASAVEHCKGVAELDQLKCLLVDGDQEANFFYNIMHIQVHRRTRALRRLADEVEAAKISSKVVSDIFLPLVDHFILGAEESKDSDLVNETVQCIARLAKHLAWSAYNKVARHYLKFSKVPGSSQKACVRVVVGVLKGFHFDLLNDPRLLEITTTKLLAELQRFLEKRDETSDEEMRIPVAEGISAILQHVPVESKSVHESALLMTLSQILRSKDQHVRDLTRSTICNIVASSDTATIGIAVKELRRALQRGPQLHVLAFSVHAILVRLSEPAGSTPDFDDALDEIVPVLGDDAFGNPAKDRQSQEFRAKTKFREVRSFKSVDSFEILARHVSPSKIAALLVPLRTTLQRTESAKVMKEVEDVFKALIQGLTTSAKLDTPGLLDLCHSLISANSDFLRPARVVPRKAGKNGKAAPDFHVQLARDNGDERDHFVKNAHRFVSFGLELFNTAFRKSRYDLDSPIIIARLEPLVSLVGNTLYSDEPVVLARSMRATASLIRCPLKSIGDAAPILLKQMINIVQRSGSTESDLAQSTLRTLAGLIRDCKTVSLREDQLTVLLQLIGPDLEEADRQGTLFQLLRSIMARKFVAPEIYDLMDKVAEMLVTNQSSGVREVCRSIYLQFLLDYPQGRGRLKTSLTFLTKNLSFVHEFGRLSVLELLNAILSKFATQLVDDAAELFFIGLVMVVANDESTKCREMAAELVKILFKRLPKESRNGLLNLLHAWAGKKQPAQLARTAIQLFGVAIDALGDEGKSATPPILDVLGDILDDSQERLQQAEESGDALSIELDNTWQLPYQALQALAHVFKAFPALVSPDQSSSRRLWQTVQGHLLFPHIWIHTSSARLLGSLYAANPTALARTDFPEEHPLSTPSLLDAAQKGCLQLKSSALDEPLAMQIVKNLFFAAKCFDARRSAAEATAAEDENEEEDAVDDGAQRQADPLRWLFTRLSYQARQAHIARPSVHALNAGQWSLQPSSILRWFAAVISHLDKTHLERFLVQMATPIFRISEDPNAQDPQMVELQNLAREVQELLQSKVGTTMYSNVHTTIRQRAAERRNERKTAMALQVSSSKRWLASGAINNPELDAQRKAKRSEQKTRQKKRKNAAFADQKGRFGKRSRRDD